ncbi:hypothetical protein GEV33_000470 [Tenebrio molitor]|uniref:Uncharacterized protein n=1 Tax=Tenebrio molitor TaxID=7067 RepID=A0A8J6LQZ2_TENMO|nr:hypothetical protein GEV33_000470 [Tenebrio molitor]
MRESGRRRNQSDNPTSKGPSSVVEEVRTWCTPGRDVTPASWLSDIKGGIEVCGGQSQSRTRDSTRGKTRWRRSRAEEEARRKVTTSPYRFALVGWVAARDVTTESALGVERESVGVGSRESPRRRCGPSHRPTSSTYSALVQYVPAAVAVAPSLVAVHSVEMEQIWAPNAPSTTHTQTQLARTTPPVDINSPNVATMSPMGTAMAPKQHAHNDRHADALYQPSRQARPGSSPGGDDPCGQSRSALAIRDR